MNALSNVYNYSKDKSGTMFNYRKSKAEKEMKKETSWINMFHTKYEETKNTSCRCLTNVGKIIKKGGDRIWIHLSFLQFNENPKYTNFPWYKRVYFILKDQIKEFLKIRNSEVPAAVSVVPNENVDNEMKASEKNETQENRNIDEFVKYDSLVHSCYSQNSAGQMLSKCNRFFKRTNSECMNEKEDNFPAESKLLDRESLPSRYRTVSLFSGFMPFGNKHASSAELNDMDDVDKNKEAISNNEEQDTATVVDKVSDKDYETATSEPVTAETVATESAVVTESVVATEPVTKESIAKESIVTEPVINESATTEQVDTEPVTAESVATEECTVEEISTSPGKDSDVADSNGLKNSIKKNLNIKSAWSKLSNFIA